MRRMQYIDGLRGIAVLAVVFYHFFPNLHINFLNYFTLNLTQGGFLGVDIFFVISGFVISAVIFSQIDNNKFKFLIFYKKRINRLFPSLIVCLCSSVFIGYFALISDEFKQLGKHLVGTATFSNNFLLIKESGYFDNNSNLKPLLHLWSLSIEEQFYIIFPMVVFYVYYKKINFLYVAFTIFFLSFCLHITQIKIHPINAFYFPHLRIWEFMIGSISADIYLNKKFNNLNFFSLVKVYSYIHFAGFFLIISGFVFVQKEMNVPGFYALFFPVLGTALILSASKKNAINKYILTNKILVFFGLISYPLYLWHWILFSFSTVINSGINSRSSKLLLLFTSIILACLTYKFIEKPIRQNKSKLITLLMIILLICLGFTGQFIKKNGYVANKITENISQFNALTMDENRKKCNLMLSNYKGLCIATGFDDNLNLASVDKANILLIGDSHAETLMGGLENTKKINALFMGQHGCLPFLNVERNNKGKYYECPKAISPIYNLIKNKHFSNATIIVNARYAHYVETSGFGEIEKEELPGSLELSLTSKSDQKSSLQIFEYGLYQSLKFIEPNVKKIIFIHQVPEIGFTPRGCINRPFSWENKECSVSRNLVKSRQENYRRITKKVLKEFPNVIVIDPTELFCDDSWCRPYLDHQMLYRDSDHLSKKGAEKLMSIVIQHIQI